MQFEIVETREKSSVCRGFAIDLIAAEIGVKYGVLGLNIGITVRTA